MARPAGYEMSREAWDDVLALSGRSLTEVASLAEVPRPTLSSLYGGHSRASLPMCHRIASGAGCHPATLFPALRSAVRNEAKAS